MKLRIESERSFWWLVVAVFALLVVVNYFPAFYGKIPFPKEFVLQFPPWAGTPSTEPRHDYADIGDVVVAFYPFRSFAAEAARERTLPLWNPYILSGIPFLANAQSALFYPPNFLYYVFSLPAAWTLCLVLRTFLAALFTALLVRSIGGTRAGAILSGIIFASCGFMSVWQGQPMSDAAMWLPFICYAVDRLHRDRSRLSTALIGVAFAMPVLAGHPETALHVTAVGLAMALFLWIFPAKPGIRAFNWQFAKWFVLGGILAVGLASVQVVPTLEWIGQTERHLNMAWPSLAPNQAIGLFSRDIFGSPNTAGIRMPEGTAYLGMISGLLAAFAPFHARRRQIVFFAALTASALAIAYSIDPMYWLASHTPIIGALKNGRFVLVASFGFAVLAGLGLSVLEEHATTLTGRKRATSVVLLSAAFLLSLFLVYQLQQATGLKAEFMRRPSFSRALLFAGIIPILWKLFGGLRGLRFPLLVCAVAVFDFFTFSYGAIGFSRPDQIYPAAPVFAFLKSAGDPSTFRVVQVDLPYPANTPMMYRLAAADGYEISLARTQTFWRGLSEDRMDGIFLSSQNVLGSRDRRLDLLNVKYVVAHATSAQAFAGSMRFAPVFNNGYIAVYENKSVLPRGFTVPVTGIEVVPDLAGQLSRLQDGSFDPEESVITSEPPPPSSPGSEAAALSTTTPVDASHVEMTSSRTQEIEFRTQTLQPSIFVLSQTYYPGWTATVDGNDTPVFPADLALTGISLPAGAHDVRFAFRPASVKFGMEFSAVSLVILCGLLIAGIEPATLRKYSFAPLPRFKGGLTVLLFILLMTIVAVNVFQLEQVVGTRLAETTDEISLYDRRIQQLRAFLPTAGEVGYLSDEPVGDAITNPAAVRKFYLTQYALVPLVVRPGVEHELVIGNFSSAASAAVQMTGLTVVRDFGDGLMLLRRKAN